MRIAVMQPYFFPYIGYFQLISAVDLFIVYDNIKYTKRGWINRNRMLQHDREVLFSLSLKKDSDYLHIVDRELSPNFDRVKLLNRIKGAYARAPFFSNAFPFLERIIQNEEINLFRYLHNSIIRTCEHLDIATEIVVSSDIHIDHRGLRKQDKVLALCKAVGANTYVNASGGKELYSRDTFEKEGIDLKFIQSKPFEYRQFGGEFVP